MYNFLRFLFSDFPQNFGLIASIVVIIKWNALSKLQTWVGLLIFSCFTFDVLAASFSFQHLSNQWIYAISSIFETSIIGYIYHQLFRTKQIKTIVLTGILIYVALSILNLLFVQGVDELNTFTIVPGMLAIALLAYLHLRLMFEDLDAKPFHSFFFWFSVGALVDNVCSAPVIATLSWFPSVNENAANNLYFLSTVFYCTWFILLIIGLIWTITTKPTKSFSS